MTNAPDHALREIKRGQVVSIIINEKIQKGTGADQRGSGRVLLVLIETESWKFAAAVA